MKIRTRLLATTIAALGLLGVGAAPAMAEIDDLAPQPQPCWHTDTCVTEPGPEEPEDHDDYDYDDEVEYEVEYAPSARPVQANANFTG